MIKDIEFKKVEDIILAIIPKISDQEKKVWEVFIINLKSETLSNVIVSSRGFGKQEGEEVKTSTLRHFFPELSPVSYQMVEHIHTDVFSLHNEYWVSFSLNEYLFDKKFTFVRGSIEETHFTDIPLIGRMGVMID